MPEKKWFLLGAGILALVLLVFLLGSNLFSIAGGFTTLSISRGELSSSDPIFSGEAFIVHFVDNGGLSQYLSGQRLGADESPSALTQLLQGTGKVAGKGFEFSLINSSYSCEYPIEVQQHDSSNPPFSEFVYTVYTDYDPLKLLNTNKWQTDCQAKNSAPLRLYGKYSGGFDYFCIFEKQDTSRIGILPSQGTFVANSTFTYQTDGGTLIQKTLSNSTAGTGNQRQERFGDDAYLQMTGFTYSGNGGCTSIGGSDPASAFYRPANNQWTIIKNSNYQDYKNQRQSLLNYVTTNYGNPNRQTVENFVNSINQKRATAYANEVTNKRSDITGNTYSLSKQGDQSQGKIVWQAERYFYPNFVLYIKAASLLIHTPVPDIKIVSASSIQLHKSGEPAQTSVTVKNNGDSGNFDLSVICEGAQQQSVTAGNYLAVGQQNSYNVSITTSCSTQRNNSCTAKTVVNGLVTSTMNFSDSCSPQQICQPNLFYCAQDGKTVQQCKNDGSGFLISKTCGSTETCDVSAPGNCRQGQSLSCGDGICSTSIGETSTSCPLDCNVLSTCNNNGVCEGNETEQSCPRDCAVVPPECGLLQKIVVSKTPQYLFWVIPIGTTIETSCGTDWDAVGLIVLVVILVAAILGGAYYLKKKVG